MKTNLLMLSATQVYEKNGGGAARRNHIPCIEGGHVAWLSLEAA
jgi:hypothetical protein